jgi:hypothetical protein
MSIIPSSEYSVARRMPRGVISPTQMNNEVLGENMSSQIENISDIQVVADHVLSHCLAAQDSILRMLEEGVFHPLIEDLRPAYWDTIAATSKQAFISRVIDLVKVRRFTYLYSTKF